jgi:GNAT superfamily N-acetyltransferase
VTDLPQGAIAGGVYEELARLHVAILPDSMVGRLGPLFAARFYRFVFHSPDELALFEEEGGCVAAGAVVSLRPATLGRRAALRTPFLLYVASRPGALPWMALFREYLRPAGRRHAAASPDPELVYIFTDPERRGRGHGRRLLQRLERLLIARGVARYTVCTFDDPSDPAVRFYLANGFAVIDRLRRYGMSYLVLERSLAPASSPN